MKIVKLYNNTRDPHHYFSVCGWNIRRQSTLDQWVITDPEQQVRGEPSWMVDRAIEGVLFKFTSVKEWVSFGPQHCPKGTVVQFGNLRSRDMKDADGQPLKFEVDHLVKNGWRSWLAVTSTKDTSLIWANSPEDQYVTINVDHITQVVHRGQGGLVIEHSPFGMPYFSKSATHERECIERLKTGFDIFRQLTDLRHLVYIWVSRAVGTDHVVDVDLIEGFILKHFRLQNPGLCFTTRQLKNLKRLALRNRNRLLANTHRRAREEADRDQRQFESDFDLDHDFEEDFSLLDDRI